MKSLNQIAKENGFKRIDVTREEHEAGIGSEAGVNFVKKQAWFNLDNFLREVGLEKAEVKTLEYPSLDIQEAKNYLVDYLKKSGFSWCEIYKAKNLFGNTIVCARAGK